MVLLIRVLGQTDVSVFDVVQKLFPDKTKDFVISINEQDIALIQELASHYSDKTERYETTVIGLEAVAVWPDSRFWPMLRRIRNFVVWKHYTDGDYNDLMQGCTKAAYHYYSPQALRYIRSFSTLTLGKMDAAWDFCEACWQDNAWHKEGFSGRVPECYKTYFRKYQNR